MPTALGSAHHHLPDSQSGNTGREGRERPSTLKSSVMKATRVTCFSPCSEFMCSIYKGNDPKAAQFLPPKRLYFIYYRVSQHVVTLPIKEDLNLTLQAAHGASSLLPWKIKLHVHTPSDETKPVWIHGRPRQEGRGHRPPSAGLQRTSSFTIW